MLFSRWFRRGRQARPTRFVRPSVVALEDRTLPSGFLGFLGGLFPTPGPATHLSVKVLAFNNTVQSGREFDVVVTARDANNLIATGFTDPVSISLSPGDSNAIFPTSYTFTSSDHGIHIFDFTLVAAPATQTITVADAAVGTTVASGLANVTVTPAPAATQFKVLVPPTVLSGGPVTVTILALDANGFPTSNYSGSVDLSFNPNSIGVGPTPVSFPASDLGRLTFVETFTNPNSTPTPGTFTATDTANSISGSAPVTVDPVGAVTHLGIVAYPFAVVGYPAYFVVAALDASNHVVAGYAGTVTFTSSDGAAVFSTNPYTFQASDNGFHVFSVTFSIPNLQSVTVTDNSPTPLTASVNIWVFQKYW
ncbi:MAG TPA: hypothetical protein VKE98_22260 [Gemmataceae bacterium]|nr:hypothetical protein [Gemmataceae bacterium]